MTFSDNQYSMYATNGVRAVNFFNQHAYKQQILYDVRLKKYTTEMTIQSN